MNIPTRLRQVAVAALGALLLSASAGALADPPTRVARLAYINGAVSFAPAGQDEWVYASLNRPLIPGDRLWAEPGARDEIQVGGASLRMAGGSLVTVLGLDDRITQLQLSQGRLNLHVRAMRPEQTLEIDTPNLALTIRQSGDYRVEVEPDGVATLVMVRRGQAEAYGEGNAYRIDAPEAFRFGGVDLRQVQYAQPDLDDEFDRWAAARDARVDHAIAARYVSPELVGYEDLDEQGSWRSVPSYGNVWVPARVAPDWAPYRDGHWTWIAPWGWTWVDNAPWGFAVSHYGRWARLSNNWCWVPGPRVERPVYAPALVVFVGFGGDRHGRHDRDERGDRHERNERPVGWFPLAPHEAYRPSYSASPAYVNNINVTNTTINRTQITNVTNINYVNRGVGGAITAVPESAFVQSRHVAKSAIALPAAALAGALVATGAPLAPQPDSVRGGGPRGHRPPAVMTAQPVLARSAPAAVPFPHTARPLQGHGPDERRLAATNVRLLPPSQPHGPAAGLMPQHGVAPILTAPNVAREDMLRGRDDPARPRDAREREREREHERGREQQRPQGRPGDPPRQPPMAHAPVRMGDQAAATPAPNPAQPHALVPGAAPVPPASALHGERGMRHPQQSVLPVVAAPLAAQGSAPAPAPLPSLGHAAPPLPPPALRHAPTPLVTTPLQAPPSSLSVQHAPQPAIQHAPPPMAISEPPPRMHHAPVPVPVPAAPPAVITPQMHHAPTPVPAVPPAMPPQMHHVQPPAPAAPPAAAPPPAMHHAPTPAPAAPPPAMHHAPTPAPAAPPAGPPPPPPPLRHAPTPAPVPAAPPPQAHHAPAPPPSAPPAPAVKPVSVAAVAAPPAHSENAEHRGHGRGDDRNRQER